MRGLRSLSLGWCSRLHDSDIRNLRCLCSLRELNISRTKVRRPEGPVSAMPPPAVSG